MDDELFASEPPEWGSPGAAFWCSHLGERVADPEDPRRSLCVRCGAVAREPDLREDMLAMHDHMLREYLGEAEWLRRQVYGD